MKLCRFFDGSRDQSGLFEPGRVLPLKQLAERLGFDDLTQWLEAGQLESLLPTDSPHWQRLLKLKRVFDEDLDVADDLWIERSAIQLLPPIARPNKLLLLAGNYAAHIREQGGMEAEKEKTFPYVFMKPASTTLVGDAAEVTIPEVSPDKIDHEVELAMIIGRLARRVSRCDALDYVAGYTIINDLSDRGFRPNPTRLERPRDKHFDWLHGKWHDGFCPCGPNLTTADEIPDPQQLELRLWVDEEIRQSGSTADQIFSVAEVIEFLSQWVTLEPGDIIATGTPAGVSNATGNYLRPGQTLRAEIPTIGILSTRLI